VAKRHPGLALPQGGVMEVTISGKQVTLRDKITAKANWHIFQRFQQFGEGTLGYEGIVDLLAAMIESWDYNEDDPTARETYDDLDLFSDIIPMLNAVGSDISRRVTGEESRSKNLPKKST